jgi:hypothetical protein
MIETRSVSLTIDHEREGSYFTLPLQVPEGVESIAIAYRYPRRPAVPHEMERGTFTERSEVNVVDIGLLDPHGEQVGATGSDKSEIMVSEVEATPGYRRWAIVPGEWQIVVGAYVIAPEGVTVEYTIRMQRKARRLLKGDIHTHTLASDGVHTAEELAYKALRNGLDFVVITDHNQPITRDALPRVAGVTMIPGLEWTHYRGHAGFLGVEMPYDGCFATNSDEEAQARFESARARGAVITINHPFDAPWDFRFDLGRLPHDCIEIWNGPMRACNLQALAYWHRRLEAGERIVACGGSDYHRDTPFLFLGGPTMAVYAESAGPSDILAALRAGRSFITYSPEGPEVEMSAGEASLGGSVRWAEVREVRLEVRRLEAGDVVRAVTGRGSEVLFTAATSGSGSVSYRMEAPGFVRVEVLRVFVPGTPAVPAAVTNPIWFEGEEPAVARAEASC